MEVTQIRSEYEKAHEQAQMFAPVFKQYQRLAANKLDVPMGRNPFPFGEGTAASLIRKMPQRVLRQMPVGRLRNISDRFKSIMCEFLVDEVFARNARIDEGLIQTLWSVLEAGMTYGFCTVTPFFTRVRGDYTVDFRLHYWADVMPAPGVKNMNAGDVFIREWWAPDDVRQLIEAAKDDPTLDAAELSALLESGQSSRDSDMQSEPNRTAGVDNLGCEVVRYYVRESGRYMLYVFRPGSERLIQAKELPCRGHVTCYHSPDFLTAYGRSILGLIGGIQIDLDNAQLGRRKVREHELNPMLIVKGYTLSRVQLRPGTVITMPVDSDMSPFRMETPSLLNYNQDHAQGQALIYNLAGYPEATLESGAGGDGSIGKTPAAIRRAQANIDAADNQVAHNLKLFLEQLFAQSLLIYFDAMPEAFAVDVSAEYASRLLPVAPERFVGPQTVVVVDNRLDLFDYEIDIESGKDDVNAMRLDSIVKTLGLLEQSPMLAQRVMTLGIADDLVKEVVYASGLNNDSIARKLSFLDNANTSVFGQPGGDPGAGQPVAPEVALAMASPPPQQSHNPVVQTQPGNPVRQMGVM